MNRDLAITISDVWLIAKFIFLLPAKLIVGLVHSTPSWAKFFEVDCGTGESYGGALFSFFVWWFCYVLIAEFLKEHGS
jgi:hypothetical protein